MNQRLERSAAERARFEQRLTATTANLRQTIETADFNRLRRTCYSLSESTRRAA